MRGPAAPPAGSPRAAFAGASPSPARPPPPPMPAAPPARVAIPPPMPPGATATAPLAAAAARPSSGNGASTPAPSQPDEGDISTSRLRQIYGQYVEAKRRCNESTATITFDKVAKNLRTTAMQLKDKHQGRNIDFEVVVKNGTPVLKPVVKGRT